MSRRILVPLILAVSLIAFGYWLRLRYSAQLPDVARTSIENSINEEYEKVDREASAILRDSLDVSSRTWDNSLNYFVYVDSTGVKAWNRNEYIPELSAWTALDSLSFFSNQRGDYLLKKWPFGKGFLFHVLTLKNRYHITNSFLSPDLNEDIFAFKDLDLAGPSSPSGIPIRHFDQTLFHVSAPKVEVADSAWSFGFILAGVGMLFMAISLLTRFLQSRWGADIGFIFLLVSIYAVRWSMVQFGFPALFAQSDIFDPKIFASSALNASMGDLLLNAIGVLLLIVFLFRNFNKLNVVRYVLSREGLTRWIAAIICLLLSFFAVLFSYNFIEVIYHNSSQTLDISQAVPLNWVRVVAFLAVLTGTISAFLFVHMLVSLSRHLVPESNAGFLVMILIAAVLFFAQYVVSGNDNSISLVTALIFIPLIRWLRFDKLEFKFTFRFFIYLVFSLTVFSVHHSLTIRVFHMERLVRDQFRYAKDFLTERDVFGEYLLEQARLRIAADQFIKARMASPLFTKNAVIDKVKRVYLNSYFDRYELDVTTRSSLDTTNLTTSNLPASGFVATGYPGILYAGTASGEAVRRYHVGIPIEYQRPVGSVELDLVLKRIVPDNVFPELLVDNRFSQIYRNRDFSYAIFRHGRLVNSFGSFNYERDFPKTLLGEASMYDRGLEGTGYFHVGLEESESAAAIVSAPLHKWSSFATNVSAWFVIGLMVLLVVQGMAGGISLLQGSQIGYTARIQLFLFLAFVLPVLAVSMTTLTWLGRSNEAATKQDFLERSAAISQRVEGFISVDSAGAMPSLENWLVENAPVVKTDISVYSPEGKLFTTSQPTLFEDRLLSTRMNREAFREIVIEGSRNAVTNERIGDLQYSCAYTAVLSPKTGRLIAVVSLPFFESATFLQRGQTMILANILNVFVIVFLIFSFLSFLAAGNLTFPIRFITRKLKQTTFTGENKPITWKTTDEIGLLVNEYNRMVLNLDDSKRALAQSEKESAWREMAKQVAHEIKNPLTPMKLTLQQMEQGLGAGDLSTERSKKSVAVLLRQVEILNDIASSFSSFARMPSAVPQRLDLIKALTDIIGLFNAGTGPGITLKVPSQPLWISIDPSALHRAISNMIINAMQAGSDDRPLAIEITVSSKGPVAHVAISDNGVGIPASLQPKVFQPQFTTKQSGTGLGLAMTRQAIVQAGGRAWFESSEGKGTTFYVELPIVE
ncbi:MAG: hypothetical protein JNK10_02605 [Cyclobacteriaceae bacterium]|nr:hypothetical protein [Cyclobacteriaceae bacterium]